MLIHQKGRVLTKAALVVDIRQEFRYSTLRAILPGGFLFSPVGLPRRRLMECSEADVVLEASFAAFLGILVLSVGLVAGLDCVQNLLVLQKVLDGLRLHLLPHYGCFNWRYGFFLQVVAKRYLRSEIEVV